jgi:predicted regulator of Ras-like GTPase activity (Roadblock/LC7/MglB family)
LKARARTNEVETSFTNDAAIMTLDSENSAFASLSASLAEIRKLKGVLGYILRSNTSAIIDLNETDKLIENAVLSSQMHDSSIEIAEHFNMGDVESVLVEGKTIKVLCMNIDENKISIFMEKSATHAGIIKRILL